MATSAHLRYTTDGNGDVVDLTAAVASVVEEAGSVTSGIATVFVPGATAAVTTMENEPGNVFDLRALLDRLVPPGDSYHHNRLNHDTNAHAHIRAALRAAGRPRSGSTPTARSGEALSVRGRRPSPGPSGKESQPGKGRHRRARPRGRPAVGGPPPRGRGSGAIRAAGVEGTEWQDDRGFVRVQVADLDGYRVEFFSH